MIDIDREIRATLDERAGLAPPPVDARLAVRVARRRQLGVALAALTVVAAVVVGSIAGVSALTRSSERRVPVGPVETPSVSIAPAATCPPGSTPDRPGPVDQARPSSGPIMPMAFDRDSGRIVLLQAADRGLHRVTTWTFDVCTNTWQQMSPDREPSGGGHLVYDADSDLTIAVLAAGEVWAYDLESDTWTEKGRPPIHMRGWWRRIAYDPVSGLVVLREAESSSALTRARTRLWTYDVDSDVWVKIHEVTPTSAQPEYQGLVDGHMQFVYDASVGRFVGFGFSGGANPTSATWTFDLPTATWSRKEASPPAINYGWSATGGESAYDEAAGMTVTFSSGFVAGYDASADRWMNLYGRPSGEGREGPGPLDRDYHAMVYDPTNERLVVYGGLASLVGAREWQAMDEVWAFDVATREWTRLLAPSRNT
jgi:Galactose oxidase, central domain